MGETTPTRAILLPRCRVALLLAMCVALTALGSAFLAETFLGTVPCALCLLERWPWRIVTGLALAGLLLPRRLAPVTLALIVLVALAGTVTAGVHLGVEGHLWPSPMPECTTPRFTGGTIEERLASMPARPSKPCDEPTYIVPGLPLSVAALNLIANLSLSLAIVGFLLRGRSEARPHAHPIQAAGLLAAMDSQEKAAASR